MKKILVSCGSGVATSTMVNNKVQKLLDDNGYKGKYTIKQVKVTEAALMSDQYDFLISTTQEPANLKCDFVSGVSFLTGMNEELVQQQILELMEK